MVMLLVLMFGTVTSCIDEQLDSRFDPFDDAFTLDSSRADG